MGLVKQYLRYRAAGIFNVIGSNRSNVLLLDYGGVKGRLCAVGACEHVFIWDIRKGERILTLGGAKHEVTSLAKSPDQKHIAVGYSDGTVKVFNLGTGESNITFSGHKSAITALNYDHEGVRLVSGANDTDLIVWDIIDEAGLFRLRGHKGVVTQARFLRQVNVVITSSKDTLIKFWDLETQHCFKTLVGHQTEIWDFVLGREEQLLLTGSGDSEIRVWKIKYAQQIDDDSESSAKRQCIERRESGLDDAASTDSLENDDEDDSILSYVKIGSIPRRGKDRVTSMLTDASGTILGCHGNDTLMELFRINTEYEAKKHLQKKHKKAMKKAEKNLNESKEDGSLEVAPSVEDDIRRLSSFKMHSKLRSFDIYLEKDNLAKIVGLLTNNTLESCQINVRDKVSEPVNIYKLSVAGHRSDVRTLSFSSDNTAILSASGDTLKIWNRTTQHCIRTVSCDYALSSLFAPGDRHVVLGTKSGKLQVFDIAAGILLETVDAHDGAIWTLALAPDKRGFVSGSADNLVKFWDFELITDESYSTTSKRLSVIHTRTLKMKEDVLCVKFSSDHKFIAVSLLDNTVKVFFADTLKFFLSLYGHKLPVLCMDISSDSTLLVTGSADRNVKLWGLDFGDCHKSIFAHDDSIMCVQFVPKTHMFFTGGKDKNIKQWDGDSFEQIQTLKGHQAEIWSLAISTSGNFLVSASHDKSLRLWEKTEEPLILDEEKEMEREKQYEEGLGNDGEVVIPGETNKEASLAGKKTLETVKATEWLIEAIELYRQESAKLLEHEEECKKRGKNLPAPDLHPLLQAYGVHTPDKYVLEVILKIRSSELEECLLVMPFSYVPDLLKLLEQYVKQSLHIELCCRCLFFLLRIHQGQITANQMLLPVLDSLRASTSSAIHNVRDRMGFNLAGLKFLQQQIQEKEEVNFFIDATDRFRQKRKREKKKAILTIKT